MDAGAVGRLGHGLPGCVDLLDGVPLLFGSLRRQDASVRERNGDSVMGCAGLDRRDLVGGDLAVGEGVGLEDLGRSLAIGEEGGLPMVDHDVPRFGSLDLGSGQFGGLGVVVEVILVGDGDEPGVEESEPIPVGDEDVTSVPRRIEPKEAVVLRRGQDFARRSVHSEQTAVVTDDDAGPEGGDLLAAPVLPAAAPLRSGRGGAAPRLGTGGAAAGEDEGSDRDGGQNLENAWNDHIRQTT